MVSATESSQGGFPGSRLNGVGVSEGARGMLPSCDPRTRSNSQWATESARFHLLESGSSYGPVKGGARIIRIRPYVGISKSPARAGG